MARLTEVAMIGTWIMRVLLIAASVVFSINSIQRLADGEPGRALVCGIAAVLVAACSLLMRASGTD
jgi:hypothetical protein